MPSSSYHYTSTNSVSSLSFSSMSSLYSNYAESEDSPQTSQQINSTSRSRMNQRRAVNEATAGTHDARASPTPPFTPSEDQAGDEDGGGQAHLLARRITAVRRSEIHQSKYPRSSRSSLELSAKRAEHAPQAPPAGPPPAYETATPSQEHGSWLRTAIPSTPKTFAQLFPKSLPLDIAHSPTEDGNMNLSVNALTGSNGPVCLFHLRMHNLKAREFSLRRYSRDSGREICKSTRKQRRTSGTVEALEKAEKKREKEARKDEAKRRGSAISEKSKGKAPLAVDTNVRRASQQPILHQSPQTPASYSSKSPAALRRIDSGYASGGSESPLPSLHVAVAEARVGCLRDSGLGHLEEEPESTEPDAFEAASDQLDEIGVEDEADDAEFDSAIQNKYLPKDLLKLEFSNYAHLDLRRRGTVATGRRYEFEYWGVNYAWKRLVQLPNGSNGGSKRRHSDTAAQEAKLKQQTQSRPTIEYHLFQAGRPEPVATIVPKPLSRREAARESDLGSWVPPSTMLIRNEHVLKAPNAGDVCDVVMATGLHALVDDCTRMRWNESSGLLDRLAKLAPSLSVSVPRHWSKIDMGVFSSRKLSMGRRN